MNAKHLSVVHLQPMLLAAFRIIEDAQFRFWVSSVLSIELIEFIFSE